MVIEVPAVNSASPPAVFPSRRTRPIRDDCRRIEMAPGVWMMSKPPRSSGGNRPVPRASIIPPPPTVKLPALMVTVTDPVISFPPLPIVTSRVPKSSVQPLAIVKSFLIVHGPVPLGQFVPSCAMMSAEVQALSATATRAKHMLTITALIRARQIGRIRCMTPPSCACEQGAQLLLAGLARNLALRDRRLETRAAVPRALVAAEIGKLRPIYQDAVLLVVHR